jgi:hypothetical protein
VSRNSPFAVIKQIALLYKHYRFPLSTGVPDVQSEGKPKTIPLMSLFLAFELTGTCTTWPVPQYLHIQLVLTIPSFSGDPLKIPV